MLNRRSVDELVTILEHARQNDVRCTLLIGAGCSKTAGIPLAGDFVKEIQKRYPEAYQRAAKKTYPYCMGELNPGVRHDLIEGYVQKAKLNWAHVGVAILLESGYVDRIVTTNFDPLVLRACSMVGVLPAVYDLAANSAFDPNFVSKKALFHLHGQHSGFVLLNTEVEVQKQATRLGPVFRDRSARRIWVVVGYSGDNDPLVELLAQQGPFPWGVYWVGYNDSEPTKEVQEKLLSDQQQGYLISGFDADNFFIRLTQGLKLFPPRLLSHPFSHLDERLRELIPFPVGAKGITTDIMALPRKWIESAQRKHEKARSAMAQKQLMAGNYQPLIDLAPFVNREKDPALAERVAWACTGKGINLQEQAESMASDEAVPILREACVMHELAVQVVPEFYVAYNNWGTALTDLADHLHGKETRRILGEACSKFDAALQLKPDYDLPIINMMGAIYDLTEHLEVGEADKYWLEFCSKCESVSKAIPESPDLLRVWAAALFSRAQLFRGDIVERLVAEAVPKVESATTLMPDDYQSLGIWGLLLTTAALQKKEPDAERLWTAAFSKFEACLSVAPDFAVGWNNWSYALIELARRSDMGTAETLLRRAISYCERGLEIKPDHRAPLSTLAAAMSDLAVLVREEAEMLLERACDRFETLARSRPLGYEVLYDWGVALYRRAWVVSCQEPESMLALASTKISNACRFRPTVYDNLRELVVRDMADPRFGNGGSKPFPQVLLDQVDSLLSKEFQSLVAAAHQPEG